MRRAPLILALAALLVTGPASAAADLAGGTPIPRTVLALYDSAETANPKQNFIHQLAEMPLNHLGLLVTYHDVQDGLPDLAARDDLRGVLTWFTRDVQPDPVAFLEWARSAVESGLKLVVMRDLGVWADEAGRETPIALIDRLLGIMGLRYGNRYVDVTYNSRVVEQSPEVVEFERELPRVLPPFEFMEVIDPAVETHLAVEIDGNPALVGHLVVTGPWGGYAANGYVFYSDRNDERRQWIIDPFEFFRRCFDTDDLPKPDSTTLTGRRIYYSHIDGDGWFNAAEIPGYVERQEPASTVILDKVFAVYPDLPVSVGPVTSELTPERFGTPRALEVVRRIFALPHVEAATHTHTHPFDWGFYEDFSPDKESRFKRTEAARSLVGRLMHADAHANDGAMGDTGLVNEYAQPRAFLGAPFSVENEIGGSADFMAQFLPPGKRVEVVLWSGNTSPFPRAIRHSREVGLRNINGGDSRFDPDCPSYAHVSPVGMTVGDERQIYASASNEVIYTDNWLGRFHGLRDLRHFVRNTETPRRVAPFNLYYHMFSGQKQASLSAVLACLELARTSELAPITTSHYAAVGDGFFTARLVDLGGDRWRVEDRDALQTIRFDRATRRAVDFERSRGVIGQRHLHGCLYVALDPADAAPVVALRDAISTDVEPAATRPYLLHSRWQLRGVREDRRGLIMQARGFGVGDMVWRASPSMLYTIEARDVAGSVVWSRSVSADEIGRLVFAVEADAIEPLELRIVGDEDRGGV